MLVHLTFTAITLALMVLNYYVGRRNVLYPAFVFSLIWFAVLSLYMVPLIEVDRLSASTPAVVVSGVVAFSLGAAVVRYWGYSRSGAVSTSTNLIAKRTIFFFCLAILPAFFLEIRGLSAGGGLDSFMISARTAIVDAVMNGQKPFSSPIYTIAPMLAIFTTFIFLIEAQEGARERSWAWASILLALTYSILTTGRTWVLELLVGAAGIYLLKSKKFTANQAWRFVRWPLVAFLVLFSVLAMVNKDTSKNDGDTTEALAHYVFGYAVIPLAGFDYVLQHPTEYRYDANHTFRQVYPLLVPFMRFRYTPPPTLDDFVWVPYPTNVYTVFKFYYVDFGFWGMLISVFLIGAGQTWLFQRALAGYHFYMFLFALSLYPLAMVAFDDAYSLLLNNLVAVAFAALYFFVLRTISSQAHSGASQPA